MTTLILSSSRIVSRALPGAWQRGALFAVATVLAVCTADASGPSVDQAAQERTAFLRAIAEVETGGNARAVGRLGERGMYQFRAATWRQHTSRPFTEAHVPSVACAVAARHYDWIKSRLVANGRRPTPYLIAAAWNGGVARTLSGRIPSASRNYAERVVNLAALWSPSIRVASLDAPSERIAATN